MIHFSQRSGVALALTTVSLAVLTACGGGDDTDSTPAGSGASNNTPVAVTPAPDVAVPPVAGSSLAIVKLPAPGPAQDFTQPGAFTYLGFLADGTTSEVPVTVAYSSPGGTLTIAAAAGSVVASTSDDWVGVTWPTGYAGLLALDGNATLVCKTADNTGQVGVSGNLKQVTDLAELRGKTFDFRLCANGNVVVDGGITFNADGSAVFTDADGPSTFGSDEIAAYFSVDGWNVVETRGTSNFKARAFVRTTGGVTEYVIVDSSKELLGDGSLKNYVAIYVETRPAL